MMYFCCVKGCQNNNKNTRKESDSIIAFHKFPTNSVLRAKCLNAIGRPNWDPPSYTRICSEHFDHFINETNGTDQKNDTLLMKDIPSVTEFDARNVEVCCLCLANDVKMHSTLHGRLKTEIEHILTLTDKSDMNGFPQFVCYMCAIDLHKCCQFIEKCLLTQATLLDVFAHNGEVTEKLIKNVDRKQLKLNKSLSIHKQTCVIECSYGNELAPIKFDSKLEDEENTCKIELNENIQNNIKLEKEIDLVSIVKSPKKDDTGVSDDGAMRYEDSEDDYVDSDCSDDKTLSALKKTANAAEVKNDKKLKDKVTRRKKLLKRSKGDLTERELKMQEYFNIVKLSLQEQIDDWNRKFTTRPPTGDTVYQCETCTKQFTHMKTYKVHTRCHDSSRGKAECPVCKLRFKSEASADSHRRHTHEKKFHCKSCFKAFSNVATAKKHQLFHSGLNCSSNVYTAQSKVPDEYTCTRCGIACGHRQGLQLYAISAHAALTETKGDESCRCEPCGIDFASEDARRVHFQTSSRHKSKPGKTDGKPFELDESKTCKRCGTEFGTRSELNLHVKAQHRRPYMKQPGETYPTNCEHCGKAVNSRREHWWHTFKEHPAERDSYRRVITAICDTCGKGFQNKTILRIHELRHASPSVRCDECGRAFYDKYALARHAHTHTRARPFVCTHCGQTFTLRTNLNRHAKVHSNVAAYECSMCGKKFKYSTSRNLHIRTVHYKQPPPPRKKRAKNVEQPEFKL
ncbi:zinc finger protein 791 [Bombyx mori]|uniref:Uncharacterized protein n=1 Tax=Bombyx mori TaxID=7091 RepID=A0A8R2M7R7_BOMMO|nr:zinc finger protein 791 isoform X1 [Bombyx mori]